MIENGEGLMYRVVIIDDEPIIAEGLQRIISWADYGCEVVATANSGQEGIEVIREQKPEIIFTDIAMPEMDGLTMIAAIRIEFPNTMISILTGYRDFDYAKRAIELGVTRFLLKPSNLDEIKEAIQVMTEKLNRLSDTEKIETKSETEEEKLSKHLETEEGSCAGSFIVKNALTYIKEHYAHKITLSEVAEKTFVSQWHLSKLLNKHMGQSFSDILNQIRIDEAKKLLSDPALRISDIAEEVGFLDVAHFSRVFKKQTGISAKEYRNQL